MGNSQWGVILNPKTQGATVDDFNIYLSETVNIIVKVKFYVSTMSRNLIIIATLSVPIV